MWETPFLEYFLISVPQTLYHSVYGDEQLNIQFTYINQALLQYVNMKHFLQTKKKNVILFQSQTKTMAAYPLGRAVLERQKQG